MCQTCTTFPKEFPSNFSQPYKHPRGQKYVSYRWSEKVGVYGCQESFLPYQFLLITKGFGKTVNPRKKGNGHADNSTKTSIWKMFKPVPQNLIHKKEEIAYNKYRPFVSLFMCPSLTYNRTTVRGPRVIVPKIEIGRC